jgi:hypothetical protein
VNFAPDSCRKIGDLLVSIIRVGLAETKKFAEGYEAIFGRSKKNETKAAEPKAAKKRAAKPAKKKKKK